MWKLAAVVPFLKKHWYVPVFVIALVVYLVKKKKSDPRDKDGNASKLLNGEGIADAQNQQTYKAYTAQIAEGLGTAYSWYDPRRLYEDDERVFELLKELSLNEFKIVKRLYFNVYAKGRDLSTDLANLLDDKYYSILKVK